MNPHKNAFIRKTTPLRRHLTGLLGLISTVAFADPPNILLFVADDMGMGDIGAYDATSSIPTPQMDALAAGGRLMHNAHSPAAVCTPSRFGILTGTYPFRANLTDGVLRSAYDPPLLSPDRETMPVMLRRVGYRTAAFGKWHLGMKWTGKDGKSVAKPGVDTSQFSTRDIDFSQPIIEGPLDYGFDYFFGIGSSINHGPYTFVENRMVTETPTELREEIKINGKPYREGWVAPSWTDDGQGEVISGQALAFMEKELADPGTPFFIYYAAVAPHWPWVPAKTLHGESLEGTGGDDDKAPWRNDMVVQNDRILSAFVELLKDPNGDGDPGDSQLENTLIIVTSDNGADVGTYEPLRGKKGQIYEGGHRVPCIVHWPAQIEAGSASDELVGLIDLYRSFGTLTGLEPDAEAAGDSIDMLPLFLGTGSQKRAPMLTQDWGKTTTFAVHDGPWKLITREGEAVELYDLGEDLKETRNVLKMHPERVEEMLQIWEQAQK